MMNEDSPSIITAFKYIGENNVNDISRTMIDANTNEMCDFVLSLFSLYFSHGVLEDTLSL